MDFPPSPNLAATTPPPPPVHNSNTSAPAARDSSSNLTSGTADPLPQAWPQSPRPLALSYPALSLLAPAPTYTRVDDNLHSIPPREKSTRTLIIDHLVWVHAVTRFAQARAELAMTDRTGGPGTPNFERRERPEQWDENDLVASEGEEQEQDEQDDGDGREIRPRSGGSEHVDDQDEGTGPEMTSRQDLPYARRLRQRAESLEYVITSMLEQPPRDIPLPPDEPEPIALQPPTSAPVRQHVLSNGVRFRLALSTTINDLFARHAPVQRNLRFQGGGMPTLSSSSASGNNSSANGSRRTTQSSLCSSAPSSASLLRLPLSLVPFLSVSGTTTTVPSTSSPNAQEPLANNLIICPRARSIFAAGATYPITPSSSSSPRCPRHLHHSCEICLASDRGTHRTTRPQGESHAVSNGSNAFVAQGGGITGFAGGGGVGSGLVRSGGGTGTLLRREIFRPPAPQPSMGDDETHTTDHLWTRTQGARDTILTGLIPRFVRLSALVALELGKEISAATTGPGSGTDGQSEAVPTGPALVPTVQWYLLLAGLLTRAVFEGYLTAEWRGLEPLQVLLGFGLGGVAISRDGGDDDDGAATRRSRAVAADDKYAEFEPDGMPSLANAVDVLFPSRRANAAGAGVGIDEGGNADGGGGGEGEGEGEEEGRRRRSVGSGERDDDAVMLTGGEAEYAHEMGQRLARFLDIPSGTRDLTRHLEDLMCRYPVKPVERTALRFCEALEQWRGKPELEKYRTQSPMPSHRIPVSPSGPLESGGIGGAANAAVRSAIGRYFVIPATSNSTTTTTTTVTTTAMATAVAAAGTPTSSTPTDVPISDMEEEDSAEKVVIGRKRAHSAAGATAAGDRVRERRGYI